MFSQNTQRTPGIIPWVLFFVLLKIKHIKREAKSNKKKGSKKIMDLKINKAKTTVAPGQNLTNFEAIANKCLKQIKNKLYFQYKALSPVIYRMPIQFTEPGAGAFGTDAIRIYADPMDVILRYKKSQDELSRAYLHMLFHCIYLHPFQPVKNIDTGVWNIAMDICSEAAVQRLNPKQIAGDNDRSRIINDIKSRIKMFIPALVYKELMDNSMNYDFEELISLFHMDDHYWLEDQNPNNQNGDGNGDGDGNGNGNGNGNDNGDGDGDGDGDSDGNGNGGGNGNGNGDNDGPEGGDSSQHTDREIQQKQQEWQDAARQVASDMQNFHHQGKDAGDIAAEIDFLTQDKMDYEEFLRTFSVMEEKMMVNQDEFDNMYYMYGLNGLPSVDGKKVVDKKVLLIEPLEYKEDKVIKDFVIAIDTSGSCAGELVKKFLNKTYSILKETESFASRVNIHIIQCDAAIQNDTKITNMKEMEQFMQNMKLYGFGGTDFRPVFEYVDTLIKNKEFDNLCGLIYFTDGYGTYPTKPTPYKTAFAFLQDYNNRDDVPSWAMSVFWDEDQE